MAYSSNQAFLFGCVAKDGGGDGGLPHEVEMGDQVVQVPPSGLPLEMDLMGQPSWTVIVPRGKDGFGFTVFGCSPVQVGRVEQGSPAWASHLRQDDCIVKINGLNVSRSTAESVAKLVRNSKTQIVLEVFRPPIFTKPSYLHYNSDSGVVADYASTTSSTTCRSDGDYKDQLETSSNISSSTSSSNSSIFYSASMVGLEGYPSHPMPEKRYETKTNGCFQDELQGDFQQRKPLSTVTNKLVLGQSNNNKNATSNQAHKLNCVASHNANNNYDTISSRTSGCLPRMGIKSKKSSSKNNKITPSNNNNNNNNNNNDHGKIDSLSDDLDQSKSLELETKLEACIADVVSCLEDFVASCQLGVNKFVKPMRAAGLSQDHFKTLFQNIEMILMLSEQLLRHVNQSTNQESDAFFDPDQSESFFTSHVFLEYFVSFLDVKMECFCDNYERYCNGLRQALVTLVALKKDSKFGPIIRNLNHNNNSNNNNNSHSHNNNNNNNVNNNFDLYRNFPCEITLSSFLQHPLKHIKDLVLHLQSLTHMSLQLGYENDRLKKIIHTLRLCCNRINENHRSLSNLSLNTITSSVLSLAHHGSNSSSGQGPSRRSPVRLFQYPAFTPPFPSSSCSSNNVAPSSLSSSVVSSIDKELLEIQTKLVFPPSIRAFHLATASRHLIYSGNLELIDFDGNGCSVYVVLTSDMLLITGADYKTQVLNVIEEPIMLANIVGCEFHTASPMELLISVETRLTTLQNPWAPKTFCLRAPSEELKVTWKNILEQRILTCKNDREVTLATRSMDNVV